LPISEPELLPLPRVSDESQPDQSALGSKLAIVLNDKYGFWMIMAFCAWMGAVHALAPGHGKALVAAYLVGERGTAWHAILLGLVVTLTHTGAVIVVAIILEYAGLEPEKIQSLLGFIGGLLVAGLGCWLLLRRLSNQSDHVHIGGFGHHHHEHHHSHDHDHGLADHYHDESGNAHPSQPVGTWGLIVLGISGGIVPCTEAIILLLWCLGMKPALALPAILAFSAGLAAVLVAIGLVVVRAKHIAGSHWGENRLFRALPILSAAIVTLLGLWICYDSIHAPHG